MKRTLFVFLSALLLLLDVSASLCGQQADARFEQANQAYSQGDFAAAAELYESLLGANGYSAGLLYNLANSYARLGRTGKAVLNYERALRLSPGNSDIQGNLKLVKERFGLFAQEQTFLEKCTRLLTMNQWVLTATLLGGLFSLLLLLSCKYRQLSEILLPAGLGAAVLVAVSLYSAHQLSHEWYSAIVVSPQSRLMISPFAGAATVGDIKEGQTVLPKGREHGDYTYVADAAGREGWMLKEEIEFVAPR